VIPSTEGAAAQKPPLRRDSIVAAARELMSEVGFEGMSLRRLATKIGVTAPALYAHVESKGDLLTALAETAFGELIARYETIEETDPLVRLRALIEAYLQFACDEPDLFRIMFAFRPTAITSANDSELPGATAAMEAPIAAIAEATAAGVIHPDRDVLTSALTLWVAAHGLATVRTIGVDTSGGHPVPLSTAVLDTVLAGLAQPPDPAN
jgi:AcrR family transcriptional regulator